MDDVVNATKNAMPPIEDTPAVKKEGDQAGLALVMKCAFIQYCLKNAATLSEPFWYAMIANLASFKGGFAAIHMLSADYPRYSRQETQQKIMHFLDSGTGPITCMTIAEMGYNCPRMVSGECDCKAPAALCHVPMSLESLRSVIADLPMSTDDMKNLVTLKDFVQQYLYNLDVSIAEGIITYELKTRFKLNSNILRSLVTEYKKASKKYQAGSTAIMHKVEKALPPWYEVTEKGTLRFLPGVLADTMAEEQNVFYAAEQHYRYSSGVYKPITEKQAQRVTRDLMIARECKMTQIADAEKQWTLMIQRSIHEMNVNPYIINLRNGLYSVLEDKLEPHTPEYFSTVQLNVNYNPDAKCLRFP